MRHARIIAIIAATVVFAVFYLLMPERAHETPLLVSLTGMALAAGNMLFSPASAFSRKSETARLGTIGLSVLFSMAVLLIAVGAFVAAYLHHNNMAFSLDILATGLWAGFAVFQSLAVKQLRAIETQRNKRSPHANWKDSLIVMSRLLTDAQASKALGDLAEEATYLSRNTESQCEVDKRIDGLMRTLNDMCRNQNNQEVHNIAAQLRALFQEREVKVKSARRKI